MNKSIFLFSDTEHPADILDGAAAVTRFLGDISSHLAEGDSNCGISEKGAHGLFIILNALENTIEAAVKKL